MGFLSFLKCITMHKLGNRQQVSPGALPAGTLHGGPDSHQRGRAGVGNAADGFAVAGRVGWVF